MSEVCFINESFIDQGSRLISKTNILKAYSTFKRAWKCLIRTRPIKLYFIC